MKGEIAMDNGKNPFGVSFIQTSAGAMITGEIKRYQTYRQMMEETAPTRLASVSNASRDHEQYLRGEIDTDYAVPNEHVGGILYQRDFINSTWILLYTDSDLSIPTFVEWDNILHVPAWVGGVSNNRVKLVEDTYAVPRTTYYSFGNYRLVLPPANHPSVKLGDEIVLEQYENYGWVLYEHVDGEYTVPGQETVTTNDQKTYNVLFTIPYYHFDVDPTNDNPVYGQPITACSYKFICTETKGGGANVASEQAGATRCWRPVIVKDNISALITELKLSDTRHIEDPNPHPNYILRSEAKNYLWTDIKSATELEEGKVRLASVDDIDTDIHGSIAVTPVVMKYYATKTFSVIGHIHEFDTLLNVPFDTSITEANKTSATSIVTPRAIVNYLIDNYSPKVHTHVSVDITDLNTELAKKQNVLKNGTYINIEDDTVNCTIPDASSSDKGIVRLTTVINNNNKYDSTTAVTPSALNNMLNGITDVVGRIFLFNDIKQLATDSVTETTYTSFPFTTGTRGCLMTPFTYILNGKRYNIAIEWGLSKVIKTEADAPYLFMMHVPGYYKFKKIIFVNMALMPVGPTRANIQQMDSTITTLSYHRYLDTIGGSTVSSENDYVAAILLWFNQFTTAANALGHRVRLKWFVLGLVDANVIWENISAEQTIYTPYFDSKRQYLEPIFTNINNSNLPSLTSIKYTLDSYFGDDLLSPMDLPRT